MAEKSVTVEMARRLLDYDPETGVFLWNSRPVIRVPDKAWNDQWAGKIAGAIGETGYRTINIKNARCRAHRLAWLHVHGSWPIDHLDHINGQRDDNRIANLRAVTRAENMKNVKMPSTNKSGVVGVLWNKRKHSWRAFITLDHKQRYLGHFKTFDLAVEARKAAEVRLGFHANHGQHR